MHDIKPKIKREDEIEEGAEGEGTRKRKPKANAGRPASKHGRAVKRGKGQEEKKHSKADVSGRENEEVARLRLRTAQLEAALLAAQQSSSVPIPSPSVAHSGISGVQPLASLLPAYSGVPLQSQSPLPLLSSSMPTLMQPQPGSELASIFRSQAQIYFASVLGNFGNQLR